MQSWWALLALPALVLIAFAFAGAGILVATLMRELHPTTQYVQLFMLPMFLFATTFYPLSVYPGSCSGWSRCCRCTTRPSCCAA